MKSNKKKASHESLDKKEQNKKLETSTTMELKLSEDGHAIVNSDGKEIARFSEGFVVRLTKGTNKLPGHMVCDPKCQLYDDEGNCIRYTWSCHWEFPPFDF